MPRVTVIISSLSAGGAERAVTNQANYMVSRGWPSTVITLTPSYEHPFYSLDNRISHRNVDFDAPSSGIGDGISKSINRHNSLRKAILDSRPECIISHLHVVNVRTLLATLRLTIPVIVTEHGWPYASNLGPIWGPLRHVSYRWASLLVAPAQGIIDCFSSPVRLKSRVIPNAVVLNQKDVVGISGDLPQGYNIVAMGRLVRVKRFDLLLKAFSQMSIIDNCHLHVVGDGPLRNELISLSESLNISRRVKFWGSVNNPWQIFRDADFLVLTSDSEGFPMVALESMAMGVPVVSFDCPVGPREIIRHGIDGILVQHGNIPHLVSAMEHLLLDDEIRKRMAEKAMEIKDRFSESRIMAMWEKAINECIGRK